jgi:hypothetical protein
MFVSTMNPVLKYLSGLIFLLILSGCEQLDRKADTVRGFFRQPPVMPVLDVIRTAVPAGFCATVAMADQLGHNIPGAEITDFNGLSLIRMKYNHEYPLSLLAFPCEDIYILRLEMDGDRCVINSFFQSEDPLSGRQQIYHTGPVPVILDDHHVRAIYIRNHVTVAEVLNLDMNISQGEIDRAFERLRQPYPEDVTAAVAQDAWVIEIDPQLTWTDLSDDSFMITGGEQDISTFSRGEGNATNVLQMAIIGLTIGPECTKNPVAGFTVLREIKVETGHNQMDDLVLGTILYTFERSCSGRIKVPVATGSYLLCLGQEIEFNMTDNEYGFQ